MKHGKIERDVYLSYASRVCVGFKRRLEDVGAAERYEKERAVAAHVQEEARAVSTKLKGVESYPAADAFVDLFKPGATMLHWPILAIVGGTNLGKSMLAAHTLSRVATILGVPQRENEPSYLEVTVENNEHLDSSDFDVRCHGGALLDGVGDALILKKNREALHGAGEASQGRAVGHDDVLVQVHAGKEGGDRHI